MTNDEIRKMLLLKAAYNYEGKQAFRRASRKFLIAVTKELGLAKGEYDIRYNEGGIAVSGDATLHTDSLYVLFNIDHNCDWVLARSCAGRKDYGGGREHRNHSYEFSRLMLDGIPGFVAWLRRAGLVKAGDALPQGQ